MVDLLLCLLHNLLPFPVILKFELFFISLSIFNRQRIWPMRKADIWCSYSFEQHSFILDYITEWTNELYSFNHREDDAFETCELLVNDCVVCSCAVVLVCACQIFI